MIFAAEITDMDHALSISKKCIFYLWLEKIKYEASLLLNIITSDFQPRKIRLATVTFF